MVATAVAGREIRSNNGPASGRPDDPIPVNPTPTPNPVVKRLPVKVHQALE